MARPTDAELVPSWVDDNLSRAQRWRAHWADRRVEAGESRSPQVRRAARLAVDQGFVLTVAEARALGIDRAHARSLVRRRRWSSPRHGTLAVVNVGQQLRARITLAATAAALVRPGSVISHASAAILHGLPVLVDPPVPVLTVRPGTRAGTPSVRLRRAELESDEVSAWNGAAVTTVARTIVDLARSDRWAGLVVADAALRERLTSTDLLRRAAAGCAGWPGNRAARWVADHADALAESPLESATRACLVSGGLPRPQLQAVIRDNHGQVARVDLLWREQMLIVEADGRLKYQHPDDLWREKRRQDRLVRLGFRVERVIWADILNHPAETVDRVRVALDSARPRRR